MILDISARKHAEALLRESDRRWKALLDNVQLVVVELDIQGKIEYVNPFFLNMVGYSSLAEVRGQSWIETFIPPSQRSVLHNAFQEFLQDNLHTHYQNPILTRSGKERMIAWNNTLLKDTQGQNIGIIAIGEDITERIKIERMKGEFISVVSHELRTPLTSMQAALSLLCEKIVDPNSEVGEATLQIAAEGTDRLVRLVNDILDLERLESGKIRIEKRLCKVDEIVNTAIAQMQEMANQSEIRIETHRCDQTVEADGDRLLQVLTNLLSNAIKFSPAGSTVRVTVESVSSIDPQSVTKALSVSPPYLLFTVRDEGRGIPTEKLAHVFERFYQIDASDSRDKGGTGLGLSICRSIVEQHGGKIGVESQVGSGSTFYFTLPLTKCVDKNNPL